MRCRTRPNNANDLTRRSFLGAMSLILGSTLAGCSSLQLVLKTYPDRFDQDNDLQERMLVAFVRTVIPGAPVDSPHLTRVYADRYYPFQRYRGYFVSDLAAATGALFGHENFDRLSLAGRTTVIERGLIRSGPAGRLYTGAVFMAQYSFFAGIYDDTRGCPLIDFPGANDGYEPNTMTIDEIERHLAASQTADGNPD